MRHIRDKLWPMPKHGAINLYVHGNQKARRLGRTAQDVHLDSHIAPELFPQEPVAGILHRYATEHNQEDTSLARHALMGRGVISVFWPDTQYQSVT